MGGAGERHVSLSRLLHIELKMDCLPYILSAGLVVLLIIREVVDYHIKTVANDRRTKQHKILRGWLFGIALLLPIANQGIVALNDSRKARKVDEQTKESKERQITINSNQLDLGRKFEAILLTMVTNSSIDAAMRSEILAAEKQFKAISGDVVDLNAWIGDKSRRRALDELQARQTAKKSEMLVWDGTVRV